MKIILNLDCDCGARDTASVYNSSMGSINFKCNHYVVHLQHILLCINYISIFKREKKNHPKQQPDCDSKLSIVLRRIVKQKELLIRKDFLEEF